MPLARHEIKQFAFALKMLTLKRFSHFVYQKQTNPMQAQKKYSF
jgi:hypothetical protein